MDGRKITEILKNTLNQKSLIPYLPGPQREMTDSFFRSRHSSLRPRKNQNFQLFWYPLIDLFNNFYK